MAKVGFVLPDVKDRERNTSAWPYSRTDVGPPFTRTFGGSPSLKLRPSTRNLVRLSSFGIHPCHLLEARGNHHRVRQVALGPVPLR
jgi:hypothetical protein